MAISTSSAFGVTLPMSPLVWVIWSLHFSRKNIKGLPLWLGDEPRCMTPADRRPECCGIRYLTARKLLCAPLYRMRTIVCTAWIFCHQETGPVKVEWNRIVL